MGWYEKASSMWRGRHGVARDQGVTSLEYAIIAGLIAIGIVVGATLIGRNTSTPFENVSGALP